MLSFVSVTFTSNDTSVVFPASTFTFDHVIFPSAIEPPSLIEPSTNSVFSGILSVITVCPSVSELFLAEIMYLNVSPTFTSLSNKVSFPSESLETTFATFSVLIIGVLASSVGLPSTVALFFTISNLSSLTNALNETSIASLGLMLSIFHSILLLLFLPLLSIESFTRVVPSGIVSYTNIFFASIADLFSTLIMYVIVSPF